MTGGLTTSLVQNIEKAKDKKRRENEIDSHFISVLCVLRGSGFVLYVILNQTFEEDKVKILRSDFLKTQ